MMTMKILIGGEESLQPKLRGESVCKNDTIYGRPSPLLQSGDRSKISEVKTIAIFTVLHSFIEKK